MAANRESTPISRNKPEYVEPIVPLNERIERIKSSIDRVNQLMAELKRMTPSADKSK